MTSNVWDQKDCLEGSQERKPQSVSSIARTQLLVENVN